MKIHVGSAKSILARLPVFLFVMLSAGLLNLAPVSCLAANSETVTLFLPLKIISPAAGGELTSQADSALAQSLSATGHTLQLRQEVALSLDYQGSWPPALPKIQALPQAAGMDYVAVGSLTQSGEKISIDLKVLDLLTKTSPVYFYREGASVAELSSLSTALVKEVLAYTERAFTIAKIEIVDNKRIDSGAILQRIKSARGDRYNPGQLRDDLKNIFQMGYFDDVRISVQDTEKGKEVAFRVVEKPLIGTVSIEGADKIKEEEVREVISLAANDIINPNAIQDSVEKIRKLYKEKGFYNTEVEVKQDSPDPNRVNISLTIKEGPKIYIKEIRVVGNTTFTEKEIKKVLSTSEKGFFSWFTDSGLLKKEMVKDDAAKINAFYNNQGFIDAKVDEPEITQKEEWLHVTFNVSEGERYKIGTIDLKGDFIEEKATLMEKIKLSQEEYYSRKVLREDILRLTDYYAEKGFAYAEAYPLVDKKTEQKTVDIVIDIKKGTLVHINRILIKGNTRTRDKVIRREMLIKEVEPFNATALRQSHQRLQRLNYFEEINISPETLADESLMDIIVDVKEKPTGSFSIGAGYSSVDNLMFMAEISKENFMGKGQTVSLQANLSGSSKRYNLSFTEPHLNDTELLAGVDLYNWEREFDDYTKDSKGASLRFGYPIWRKWQMFFSYGYDDTKLTDVDLATASRTVIDSMDINITSSVRLGLNRDSRDATMAPSRGSLHSLGIKYAGGPLGGDSAFTKFEATSSWFFPLPKETVFHVNASAGYVMENSGGKLPVFEKFYLGGINTMRGFKSGQISPRDWRDPINGDRIGGDKMWYTNFEYLFPLIKDAGLRGLVFFDVGNVYATWERWNFGQIKKSAGFGFRWLSPMGPLRLEWGYNIEPVEDEAHSNWDFSIGGGF